MRLKDLRSDRKSAIMRWQGEELKLVYDPNGYTPLLESQIKAQVGDGSSPWQADALVSFLAGLLHEWDLLDDDGEPLPITEGVLATIPVPVLGEMMLAIGEDMRPGEAQRPSGAG